MGAEVTNEGGQTIHKGSSRRRVEEGAFIKRRREPFKELGGEESPPGREKFP